MNKLQITLFISADKVDFQENKIIPMEGNFYWNKHKYNIVNGVITCAD